MIIIDATNSIVGRLSTFVAKKSLLGETVNVINCEKAVIAGNKKYVFASMKRRTEMGIHTKGPFLPRMPDRFVRRIIRGMLPYKKPRGADAFKRIKCYVGVPESLSKQTPIKLDNANLDKLPYLKYVSVKEICKFLGAKND